MRGRIVPAALLRRIAVERLHAQDRIAVENGLMLLVERIGSPHGVYLRRQISAPWKSHAPISPLPLKNQTYLPSVIGVGDVESL